MSKSSAVAEYKTLRINAGRQTGLSTAVASSIITNGLPVLLISSKINLAKHHKDTYYKNYDKIKFTSIEKLIE
ncbi:hypothetical protein KNT64_gp099 [Pseudomonas phage PspYZU05]|uniref:Uncharacterized protein n=1 Tax=Pseudomonas phage PspYZU05 TaxID=1983556 RepID=A0A2U7NF32_9CAUD|nr:hypothetical protein KNT64_gp099 [Pseudomonas phage PspYZU05]ASD52051.1 hypothetical protein PspYZU05_99 [Pseudomonas phage PspYZU05]